MSLKQKYINEKYINDIYLNINDCKKISHSLKAYSKQNFLLENSIQDAGGRAKVSGRVVG